MTAQRSFTAENYGAVSAGLSVNLIAADPILFGAGNSLRGSPGLDHEGLRKVSTGLLSFEDLIRANIRIGYEAELRRIKADYERTGLPLNYSEYYPAMVNSLERRIDEKMQRIAMELA